MTISSAENAVSTYPLILTNLARMRCVVLGGGAVAERKVRDLLAGGARPVVISPGLTEALMAWHAEARIEHIDRVYHEGDLAGAFLVFAATGDRDANRAAAAEAAQRSILVNLADDAANGDFHTAAVVRRGDLLLAVSTGGASPALTAHIRRELEARYGEEYARLLALLRRLRSGKARALPPTSRAALWRRLVSDTMLGWLRDGEDARAESFAQAQIEELGG